MSRDDADFQTMGFRSSDEVSNWQRRASSSASTEDLSAERPTLADVLDALNVFNPPIKPDDDPVPWDESHFIAVTALPEFIHNVGRAWYSGCASSAAAVPAGWSISQTEPGAISVVAPTGSGCVVTADETEPRVIPVAVLYDLAQSLLATPAPPQADHFPDAGKMVPPQAVPATDAERLLHGLKFAREYVRKLPANTGYLNAINAIESAIDWLSAAPVAVDAAPELPALPPLSAPPWSANYVQQYAEAYARAALRAARAGSREPLTDEQIDAAVEAWFATEITTNDGKDKGRPFRQRMRAAIRAARDKA